ncbi:uncharacterized protein [Asterias amurensis]|uniref:uncharacterized protein n=1 Tax=Asterias amurensis TaxID=7602 RepID=UPI003AB27E85
MELGIGSDDDLFSEEKDTTFKEKSGWIAKQCESEWFMEDVVDKSSNSSEEAQLISYKADRLYSKKQFNGALAAYKRAIQMVASRYVLLRRILIEGASRSCMYIQDHEQALHFADMLFGESLTLEHRMMAHSLLASVHAAAGNHSDSIKSLHLCIQWQRSNVQFWLKLASAYSALYSQSSHEDHNRHARSGLINGEATDGLSGCKPTLGPLQEGASGNSAQTRKSTLKDSDAHSGNSTAESLQNNPQSDEGEVFKKGEQEQSGMKDLTGDGAPNLGTIVETSNGDHCAEHSGVHESPSSIGDLLNVFDRLAMDPDDAKLSSEAMVRNLTCSDFQPLLCAASCLLRARLLLKSVEHSVNSFAIVKNSQLQKQVDERLAVLNINHTLLEVLHNHARQIFRKGYKKLDGDASGDDKEEDATLDESSLSSELFEKRWFQWVIS